MGRIGFFEMLLDDDMSWIERERINEAYDAADAARDAATSQSDALGGRIDALGVTVAEQKREIARLRAALRVLATILCNRGLVEASQLEAAMAKAVERSSEAFAETIACPRCGNPVPPRQTVMTEHGLMCDRCHALDP